MAINGNVVPELPPLVTNTTIRPCWLGAAEEEGEIDPAVLVTFPEAEGVRLVQEPGVEHDHPAIG